MSLWVHKKILQCQAACSQIEKRAKFTSKQKATFKTQKVDKKWDSEALPFELKPGTMPPLNFIGNIAYSHNGSQNTRRGRTL